MRRSPEDIDSELAVNARLRAWLTEVCGAACADKVTVHIGDIYGAAGKVRRLVDQLLAIDPDDRTSARRAITSLQVELYEHVVPHLDALSGPLTEATRDLYEGEQA